MPRKELILVGGPNGSGKTTFIRKFQQPYPYPYLGADEIAAELAPHDVAGAQIQAGREFLLRLDERLNREESLIVESTLSGKSLVRWIERARERGFAVIMFFVFVQDAQESLVRVRESPKRRARCSGKRCITPISADVSQFLAALSSVGRFVGSGIQWWKRAVRRRRR